MCQDCGCAVNSDGAHVHGAEGHVHLPAAGGASVEVLQGILHRNDEEAAHNRAHFAERGVFAVNLMSSPGSGKTSLLEATIDALAGKYGIAVIEGDLETENDARRIRAKGVPAVQITTGQTCHLDAHMVHGALHRLDLAGIDILFIENVGNLVCPAAFDLGQTANVALLSVTEGDDKPSKYPVMFRAAELVVLSKAALLDVLDDFSPEAATRNVRMLANPAPVLALSARRKESLASWLAWLDTGVAKARAHRSPAAHVHSHDHAGA